jgi:uncharacterized iron-regulated membrane protein
VQNHAASVSLFTRIVRSEVSKTVFGLVILAAMVTSVLYVNSVTSCQTNFNVAYSAVTRERSEIADRWRDEQIDYLHTVRNEKDPDVRLAALDKYLASLEFAAAQRDTTPLPEEPRCR